MSPRAKILFFASNPEDVTQLSLDEEIRAITTKIRGSDYRNVLDLISRWAVRPDDLLQELNQQNPTIVHFSGHGSKSGELVLMDESRKATTVSPAALKALFSTLKGNIQLVVLNACYSKVQGAAIAEVIDCVVGMNASIGDRAAITFAASFYRAIGFARSVKEAFEQGKVSLMLENIPEENKPELLHRPTVDPASVHLVTKWQSQTDVVGVNLEVAREIFRLNSMIAAEKPDRRERVAAYYQKIANTLKEVVASLRAYERPTGNCEKMLLYGAQLPDHIGDLIGMDRAKELSRKLRDAYHVEGLIIDLDGVADREASLADLEKAAAYFEVSADSLLASK